MDKIKSEILEIEEILSKIDGNNSSPFLFGDLGGQALFYFYLGRYTNKEIYYDKGLKLIELVLSKSRSLTSNGSICSGIGGITWLIEICSKEGFIEENVEDIFPTADIELAQWTTKCFEAHNFDFLHGGTGTYIYLLNRFLTTGNLNYHLQIATEKLLENCFTIGTDMAYAPFYSCSENILFRDRVNMGVSHGIVSVIYALQMAVELSIYKTGASEMLNKMCNLIQFATNQSFQGYYFPYFFDVKKMDTNTASRIGWCYGDLGSAAVLLQIARRMGREDLYNRMETIIRNIADIPFEQQGLRDSSLCHGFIGNALILHQVANELNSEEIGTLSNFYLSKYMSENKSENHRKAFVVNQGYRDNFTLLEGVSGIGLGLLSLLNNSELKWKEILLLR